MNEQAARFAADGHATAQMSKLAQLFQTLAGLRGISSTIEVANGQYVCNGEPVGTSIAGAYDWLNRQPGVKP